MRRHTSGRNRKMSIPKFNNDGNLPEGIHLTEEVEFVRRFSIGSARRKWLGERLHELFVLAKLTGKLERIFVWGSFVSAKESPNDIDLLLIMSDDFQIEDTPDTCRFLFEHIRARVRFSSDVYWAKSTIGEEVLNLWLDTYQTTKDFKRRGIVEVKLS